MDVGLALRWRASPLRARSISLAAPVRTPWLLKVVLGMAVYALLVMFLL
jgi:hypothetical protein